MTEKDFKLRLIQDYERYVGSYNQFNDSKYATHYPSWNIKYISLIVYLFGEDIEHYTEIEMIV